MAIEGLNVEGIGCRLRPVEGHGERIWKRREAGLSPNTLFGWGKSVEEDSFVTKGLFAIFSGFKKSFQNLLVPDLLLGSVYSVIALIVLIY